MAKGEKMMRILDALDYGINGIGDLIAAHATSETGFGKSLPKTLRYLRKREDTHERERIEAHNRQKLRMTVAKLVREGLVQKTTPDSWRITKLGKEKLAHLKDLLGRTKRYEPEEENILKIIMFDIPKRHGHHRNWIRSALYSMGFKLIQKSVFSGTGKIAEEFIRDLDRLSLAHCVKIMGVSKKGTLEDLPR